MATRKAKPDGQYHLQPDEVDDFIRGQLVTNLPGEYKSLTKHLPMRDYKTFISPFHAFVFVFMGLFVFREGFDT